MTTSASQSGQATTQPAAGAGAASAGESTSTTTTGTTLLGAEGATQQQSQTATTGEAAAGAKAGEQAKTGGEAKAGDEGKGGQQQAKAPEKYADFKIPDGMTLDTKAVEAFSPVMQKLNLSQEAAQELVNVYAQTVQAQASQFEQQLENEEFAIAQAGDLLAPQREKWAAAIKADKEIGGTGFDANVKVAQKAIARFGTPALKQALNTTGLGNHPEFVRFCLKVGRAISEDTPLNAGSGSGARKSTEDVFYGGQAG